MTEAKNEIEVRLRVWGEQDRGLMHALLGDPALTEHIGGPETAEQLDKRHERYLQPPGEPGEGQMYAILAGPDGEACGSIGYWEKEHDGETVYEIGWSVLGKMQGKGIASRATRELIEILRRDGRRRYVHAFPSVENGASNAICRKAGMTLMGAEDFEYPKGHWMKCNDWQLDLQEGNH